MMVEKTVNTKHSNNITKKTRSVAEYISWQIALCGKPQLDIAVEAGFEKPNIVTMIKQGKTKLPLGKIGKFAKAIEVDPMHLLKLCMSEYWPDTWNEIESISKQPVLTNNEISIIMEIRECGAGNPKISTDEDRERLAVFVSTLKTDNQ
jgi:hypothetical protein